MSDRRREIGEGSGFGSGPPPDSTGWRELVKLSEQETADWLSGRKQVDWMEHLTDPEARDRYAAFKQRMRDATRQAIQSFDQALGVDSEQTQQRVRDLYAAAAVGDARSAELLITLITELMRPGLGLGAR